MDNITIQFKHNVPPSWTGAAPIYKEGDRIVVNMDEEGYAYPVNNTWIMLTPKCYEVVFDISTL